MDDFGDDLKMGEDVDQGAPGAFSMEWQALATSLSSCIVLDDSIEKDPEAHRDDLIIESSALGIVNSDIRDHQKLALQRLGDEIALARYLQTSRQRNLAEAQYVRTIHNYICADANVEDQEFEMCLRESILYFGSSRGSGILMSIRNLLQLSLPQCCLPCCLPSWAHQFISSMLDYLSQLHERSEPATVNSSRIRLYLQFRIRFIHRFCLKDELNSPQLSAATSTKLTKINRIPFWQPNEGECFVAFWNAGSISTPIFHQQTI